MSGRKIGFDRATLDDKIIEDSDDYLVMPAVIASEIVHKYPEGWAYKPASELKKAAWTADHRWVRILGHPETALLQRQEDIYGVTENPRFVKNLLDPKTKRPCRKGIKADIRWFKHRVPEDVLEKVKAGDLRDVSIGFTYEMDPSPGVWNGMKYDFVQRDIFIDHVAAPIEKGRCPGPLCGIGVDSVVKVETDKVVKRGNQWCVIHCHGEEAGETIKCFDTKEEAEAFHRAIMANKKDYGGILSMKRLDQGEKPPKDWWSKCVSKVKEGMPEYSDEQAAAVCGYIWYHKPEMHGIGDTDNCFICSEIQRVGLKRAAYRLTRFYGKDVLKVITGELKPAKIGNFEDFLLDTRKVLQSARWLLEE